jgi:hypothetical protein
LSSLWSWQALCGSDGGLLSHTQGAFCRVVHVPFLLVEECNKVLEAEDGDNADAGAAAGELGRPAKQV